MKFQSLLIFAILIARSVSVTDFIFFKQGVDSSYSYGTSQCQPGTPWEKQYSFGGTFGNIPKVIMFPVQYSVSYPTNPVRQVYMKTEITTITTTGFHFKISCGASDDILRFDLRWYAFDDKKITIITSNIISNPVDGSIQTHSHTNSVATQGFVSLNTYRFEGNLNFYVELYQMSLYTVKVKIHNSSDNLSELGYTIVIGASESIQAYPVVNSGYLRTTPSNILFWKQINSAPINACLIIQTAGIQTNLNPIRIAFFQNINTATQISSITIQTWSDSINSFYVYYFWIFQAKQIPLVCSKYRISRKFDPVNNYFISFYLAEMNLSYFNLNNQQITVPQGLTVLNFALEFILTEGKKIKGKIYSCNDCGPINYFQFEKKYTSSQNKITVFAPFFEPTGVEKYLIVNISLTGLTIIQQVNSAIMNTIVEILIQ